LQIAWPFTAKFGLIVAPLLQAGEGNVTEETQSIVNLWIFYWPDCVAENNSIRFMVTWSSLPTLRCLCSANGNKTVMGWFIRDMQKLKSFACDVHSHLSMSNVRVAVASKALINNNHFPSQSPQGEFLDSFMWMAS